LYEKIGSMKVKPCLSLVLGIVVGKLFLILSYRFYLDRDLSMVLLTGVAGITMLAMKTVDLVRLRRK
jgi:hypothetical protein